MPFDLAKFEEVFGYENDKYSLDHMMREFQEDTEASTDEFAVFQAIIATGEFNSNFIYLDEKTLQNIARASNRDTAGDDIPIFPNHNRYDFQIGTMLTGKYLKSKKRVEGTFNIIRDDETNLLINRMNNRVVRDVSPTVMGTIECDICGEKMYRYGGDKNGHYLGDTFIGENGKERLITGTFKDAKLVEVSVVAKGAFSDTVIFSENKDLLEQALLEGIIDEKALDMIEYSFSVDLGIKNIKPEPLPPEPEPEPQPQQGDPPMPKPTDTDTKLLQDQIADYKQEVADKDKQITAFQEQVATMVSADDHQKTADDLTEVNAKLIETEGKLGAADAIVSEYEACVDHVREQAIAFFAKVRGVEVDNTTDSLFPKRKQTLQDSKSLSYLLSSLEQYQNQYYSSVTEFGGQTTQKPATASDTELHVNPHHFDI